MEVVASLSQGRTAAAQCGLFTHISVPVIFEPPCTYSYNQLTTYLNYQTLRKYRFLTVAGDCLLSLEIAYCRFDSDVFLSLSSATWKVKNKRDLKCI